MFLINEVIAAHAAEWYMHGINLQRHGTFGGQLSASEAG
jgi:hypothetical protein